MRNDKIKRITTLAMLTAVSVVLVSLFHFPLFPAASYLEYDPADVPVLLASLLYGTGAGLLVTVAAAVIQGLTVSSSGGVIGIVMHIIATGLFSLTVSRISRRGDNRRTAIGLTAGVFAMTAAMGICNLIFTPLYTGMSVGEVARLLIPVILPFNLIKAGINAMLTWLLIRPVAMLMD